MFVDHADEEAKVIELLDPRRGRGESVVQASAVCVADSVLEVEGGQAVEFFVVHQGVGVPGSGVSSLLRMQWPSVW